MAQFCHFFGVSLSDVRRMTLEEYAVFNDYMDRYIEAMNR